MISISRMRQRIDDGLISDVVNFWKQAGDEGRWFIKDKDFDRIFRKCFLELHMAVAERRHDHVRSRRFWTAIGGYRIETATKSRLLDDYGSARAYEIV